MHINPAAAEATILSLCQSPQPYKACQFILGKLMLWMFCYVLNEMFIFLSIAYVN